MLRDPASTAVSRRDSGTPVQPDVANQPDVQSKPEEVRAKIVEGRLRKEFLSRVALSEQPWIHDPSQTAGKALEEAGLEVVEFVRFALAE